MYKIIRSDLNREVSSAAVFTASIYKATHARLAKLHLHFSFLTPFSYSALRALPVVVVRGVKSAGKDDCVVCYLCPDVKSVSAPRSLPVGDSLCRLIRASRPVDDV